MSSGKEMKLDTSANQANGPRERGRFLQLSDDAAAGAFSGVAARLLTAPFDVIKIRFQLQNRDNAKYSSMLQAFRTVIREEGFLSLWKGNISATYLWISYAVVQFAVYGVLKRFGESLLPVLPSSGDLLSASRASDDVTNHRTSGDHSKLMRTLVLFLAGASAGIIATATTYPLDIMRTQFALQGKDVVYKTMSSFITQTYRNKGISGFYAGLTPAVVGITPYMGLNFALYETFKKIGTGQSSQKDLSGDNADTQSPNKKKKDSAIVALAKKGLCGGAAGGLSKLIVYPLDTVKKRMQGQVLEHMSTAFTSSPARYSGVIHCCQTIFRHEGLMGFYRGIMPTVTKSVLATAVTFSAYESAKDFLALWRLERDQGSTSSALP